MCLIFWVWLPFLHRYTSRSASRTVVTFGPYFLLFRSYKIFNRLSVVSTFLLQGFPSPTPPPQSDSDLTAGRRSNKTTETPLVWFLPLPTLTPLGGTPGKSLPPNQLRPVVLSCLLDQGISPGTSVGPEPLTLSFHLSSTRRPPCSHGKRFRPLVWVLEVESVQRELFGYLYSSWLDRWTRPWVFSTNPTSTFVPVLGVCRD